MEKEPVNGREHQFSEDDVQREQLGPRGIPGKSDPAKMTPQWEKKTPKNVDPGAHGIGGPCQRSRRSSRSMN
jgi:hypothetical protein